MKARDRGAGACWLAENGVEHAIRHGHWAVAERMVWRCRLIVSKPDMKACLVAALETRL
jgi:hypothetical protein